MISILSPEQRAAVVLVSLSPENAEPIARNLGGESLRRVKKALEDLKTLSRQDLETAIQEFLDELDQKKGEFRGGKDRSERLLTGILGEEVLTEILGTPAKASRQDSIWPKVETLDADILAKFCEQQHMTVCSLILSKLQSDKAGEVLSLLSKDTALAVVQTMTSNPEITTTALKAIESLIDQELLSNAAQGDDPELVFLGEMLGSVAKDTREAAIEALDKKDEKQAAIVRKNMLSFEKLMERLPVKGVQILFRVVDRPILVSGLKAGEALAPEVVEFLLTNISQRMAETFREDMAGLPTMSDIETNRAVSKLLQEIMRLAREDELTLIRTEG